MAYPDLGVFVVQKQIVSSTLTTSDVNVFESLGNGLYIEEVVVRTDATGLAGPTNFTLKADGVSFFTTAVSGLWANAVISTKTASVLGTPVTIPAGTKYVTVTGTVASGTGAGVATVTLRCRKIDTNSTINHL